MFESTPYRRSYPRWNIIRSKEQIEDALSNISSSSSAITEPEQSFDVKEILQQVKIIETINSSSYIYRIG
jgi:hypothetical protein